MDSQGSGPWPSLKPRVTQDWVSMTSGSHQHCLPFSPDPILPEGLCQGACGSQPLRAGGHTRAVTPSAVPPGTDLKAPPRTWAAFLLPQDLHPVLQVPYFVFFLQPSMVGK